MVMVKKELRSFFVRRFRELLNRNSMDSYRVRCNNVLSLIIELREVIENWLDGYVKQFETVRLCLEETIVAIKDDNILDFSFYDKQLMLDDLMAFKKSDEKGRGEIGTQSIYLLNKCIDLNKDSYLDGIYTEITNILDSDEVVGEGQFYPLAERLDKLAGALACELLNERFSLSHLFRASMKLTKNIGDFDNAFRQFKQNHSHNVPLNDYEVILKLNGGTNNRLTSIPGFLSQLDEDFVPEPQVTDEINSFLTNRGVLFYRCGIRAHDTTMAVTMAIERMESVIDKAMLGYSVIDARVQKMALVVIMTSPTNVFILRPIHVLESNYADDEGVVNNMINKIDQIQSNSQIAKDVTDRLTSALRHLRIGYSEADTGQQLVNYWVALEYIFSSPKVVDSTIPRLVKNLINILMCCYAKRRITYVNEILHKNGSLPSDRDWWCLDEDALNDLINNQTCQLTRYHLQEMKAAVLNNHDAIKFFFSNHEKHLIWQIYRIYRYRNKLIHEAAILPGLEIVIRCQRFFLVLLLNQFIGYFSGIHTQMLSMDSFFSEYSQKINLINCIIRENISGRERVSKLMQIEVYNELLREVS